MIGFIRSLFCRHDMVHLRNLHGDEIHGWDGNRSLWTCSKCKSLEARPDLFTRVMPVNGAEMWIDDPHDIEGGRILNPAWIRDNPAKAAYMRGDTSETLVVDRAVHPLPHAALISSDIIWESWEHQDHGDTTIFYGCRAIPDTLPHGVRLS